jgi:iron(III) transport system ATP-binding protein
MQIAEHSGRYVEVQGLVKLFGNDIAVNGISFSIPRGKFVTLLGPSGCGKTTTLMSIAGLHGIDAGTIRVGGVTYTSKAEGIFLPPEKRDIGMVFQSYAIWPHMMVMENVAYPLEIRKVARDEIHDRVAEVLRLVSLTETASKLATQLSGGQQQRVALARAIVSRPRLLLFDEPLSNLDLKLREQMRVELKRIQHEVGITSIYLTHDQAEALVLSDEIIVMSKGRIEQKGSPHEIYVRPVNAYVSNFIGVANLLTGRVVQVTAPGRGEVELMEGATLVRLPCLLGEQIKAGQQAVVSVRPESVQVSRDGGTGGRIEGEVVQVIFLGNWVDCRVRWGSFEWKVLAHLCSRTSSTRICSRSLACGQSHGGHCPWPQRRALRERNPMQAAHFHFGRRDAPLSMLQIKFGPFGLAKLARSNKDQWRKPRPLGLERYPQRLDLTVKSTRPKRAVPTTIPTKIFRSIPTFSVTTGAHGEHFIGLPPIPAGATSSLDYELRLKLAAVAVMPAERQRCRTLFSHSWTAQWSI